MSSLKSVRIIDEQLDEMPQLNIDRIESLAVSCNRLGKTKAVRWTSLSPHLQVNAVVRHVCEMNVMCRDPV
jgi:hypothetical protein